MTDRERERAREREREIERPGEGERNRNERVIHLIEIIIIRILICERAESTLGRGNVVNNVNTTKMCVKIV